MRWGSDGRRLVARDRTDGRWNSGVEMLRVDPLVRLHLAVAEVEERLPADEPPRRAEAAARSAGSGSPRSTRIEDEAEERLAASPARLAR